MKTITVSAASLPDFEVKGNTSLESAAASLAGRKRVSILDVYKSVPREKWVAIVAACFNDTESTDENRSARYWRSSARKYAKMSGIESVVDYLFLEGKTSSLDTLARTYAPALYAHARGK